MNEAKDVVWRCVQPLLRDFAERVAASDSTVIYSVGSASNDAFLIRGFVSLRKATTDDEIAVTVDAAFEGDEIVLSTDACMDNGEVFADGPKVTMSSLVIFSSSGTPLAEWLGRFEKFLTSIEVAVKERVAAL